MFRLTEPSSGQIQKIVQVHSVSAHSMGCHTVYRIILTLKIMFYSIFILFNSIFFPGATQPIVCVYFTALYRALASSLTRLLNHTHSDAPQSAGLL
jgi:hypothetical protein